jgi:hypothetical protein
MATLNLNLSDAKKEELQQILTEYSAPAKAREHPVWITNLLYGNYKAGKTVQSCKVIKPEKTLLYACDINWVSILDWPELADVEVVLHKNLNHWEAFCKALLLDLPIYKEFKHVLIDPFNALVDEKLDWLQDNFTPSKQGNNRTEWTVKADHPDKVEPFTSTGMSDYGAVRDYFRRFIPKLSRMDRHLTFVCHVREPGYADPVKEIRAAVPGKTHELLARNMNLISYMEDKVGGREISFETVKKHDGGSVFRELHGRRIKAEDLPEVYKKYARGEQVT